MLRRLMGALVLAGLGAMAGGCGVADGVASITGSALDATATVVTAGADLAGDVVGSTAGLAESAVE